MIIFDYNSNKYVYTKPFIYDHIPKEMDRWIEPFHRHYRTLRITKPKKAILNIKDLTTYNYYKAIRDGVLTQRGINNNFKKIYKRFLRLGCTPEEYFYMVKKRYNHGSKYTTNDLSKNIFDFIALYLTCNSLERVRHVDDMYDDTFKWSFQPGADFDVLKKENIRKLKKVVKLLGKLLRDVDNYTITNTSFLDVINMATEKDFIFVEPEYLKVRLRPGTKWFTKDDIMLEDALKKSKAKFLYLTWKKHLGRINDNIENIWGSYNIKNEIKHSRGVYVIIANY